MNGSVGDSDVNARGGEAPDVLSLCHLKCEESDGEGDGSEDDSLKYTSITFGENERETPAFTGTGRESGEGYVLIERMRQLGERKTERLPP